MITQYNCQHLSPASGKEIAGLLRGTDAHVLALQETRIPAHHSLARHVRFAFTGHRLFRGGALLAAPSKPRRKVVRIAGKSPRQYASGGLLTAVRSELPTTRLATRTDLTAYVLAVEIALSPQPVVILNIYAPPTSPKHDDVLTYAAELARSWQQDGKAVLLLGDLNAAWNGDDDRANVNGGAVQREQAQRDELLRDRCSAVGLEPAGAHHPGATRPHTFIGTSNKQAFNSARLDDLLLNPSVLPCNRDETTSVVPSATRTEGWNSDHNPLCTTITPVQPWTVHPLAQQSAVRTQPRACSHAMIHRRLTEKDRKKIQDEFRSMCVQSEVAALTEAREIARDDGSSPADALAARARSLMTMLTTLQLAALEAALPPHLKRLLHTGLPAPLASGSRHRPRKHARRHRSHLQRMAALKKALEEAIQAQDSQAAQDADERLSKEREAHKEEQKEFIAQTQAAKVKRMQATLYQKGGAKRIHKMLFDKKPPADDDDYKAPLSSVIDPATKKETNDPETVRKVAHAYFESVSACPQHPTSASPHLFPWEDPELDGAPISDRRGNSSDSLLDHFTEELFLRTINRLPYGKAAGPDGLVYESLRWLSDSAKHEVYLLMRDMYEHATVPGGLKKSNIWLLFKDGDERLPQNYRPISLASALFKLFTSCVHQLLAAYAEQHHILSPTQRGFRAGKGAHELIHLINSVFEDANINRRPVVACFLDIKNAFPTVPHEKLLAIMTELGFPADAVTVVQEIYNGQTSSVITPYGNTDEYDVRRGTLQGDTLSPFLFIVFMEPLIRWLEAGGRGYRLTESATVAPLAPEPTILSDFVLADDAALTTGNGPDMQIQIYKYAAYHRWAGMAAGIPKCALTGLLFEPGRSGPVNKTELSSKLLCNISYRCRGDAGPGEAFPVKGSDEWYKYLGDHVTASLNPSEQLRIYKEKVTTQCNIIAQATAFYPSQKKNMLEQKVLGGILHAATTCCFSPKELRDLDRPIIAAAKRANGLSKSCPTSCMDTSKQDFGCGVATVTSRVLTSSATMLTSWLQEEGPIKTTTLCMLMSYYKRCGIHPVTGLPNIPFCSGRVPPFARRIMNINSELRTKLEAPPGVLPTASDLPLLPIAAGYPTLESSRRPLDLLPVLQLHSVGITEMSQLAACTRQGGRRVHTLKDGKLVAKEAHHGPHGAGATGPSWLLGPMNSLARYWCVPQPKKNELAPPAHFALSTAGKKHTTALLRSRTILARSLHPSLAARLPTSSLGRSLDPTQSRLSTVAGEKVTQHTRYGLQEQDYMSAVYCWSDGTPMPAHMIDNSTRQRRCRSGSSRKRKMHVVDVRGPRGANEDSEENTAESPIIMVLGKRTAAGALQYLVQFHNQHITRGNISEDMHEPGQDCDKSWYRFCKDAEGSVYVES